MIDQKNKKRMNGPLQKLYNSTKSNEINPNKIKYFTRPIEGWVKP